MKALIIIVVWLLMGGNIFGQGIEFFSGTLDEAFERAKEEKKLVFVDFYADWCGP